MRHFPIFCIVLISFVLLTNIEAAPAGSTPKTADNQVANSPIRDIEKGVHQIVKGSIKGAKEIAGGTVGRGKGDTGTGGIATGVGRIIRGALTGAGNIVGGVLG